MSSSSSTSFRRRPRSQRIPCHPDCTHPWHPFLRPAPKKSPAASPSPPRPRSPKPPLGVCHSSCTCARHPREGFYFVQGVISLLPQPHSAAASPSCSPSSSPGRRRVNRHRSAVAVVAPDSKKHKDEDRFYKTTPKVLRPQAVELILDAIKNTDQVGIIVAEPDPLDGLPPRGEDEEEEASDVAATVSCYHYSVEDVMDKTWDLTQMVLPIADGTCRPLPFVFSSVRNGGGGGGNGDGIGGGDDDDDDEDEDEDNDDYDYDYDDNDEYGDDNDDEEENFNSAPVPMVAYNLFRGQGAGKPESYAALLLLKEGERQPDEPLEPSAQAVLKAFAASLEKPEGAAYAAVDGTRAGIGEMVLDYYWAHKEVEKVTKKLEKKIERGTIGGGGGGGGEGGGGGDFGAQMADALGPMRLNG